MDAKVNYAAVGVFVLALWCGFHRGILWLAVGVGSKKDYGLYRAIVHESVAGLNVDAPVKYLGVNVGKVQKIELDPANPQEVHLLFAIEKGTPIGEDTVAVLKTQGLTGIAYVELSGSAPGSRPLAATAPGQYPMIRTKPSLSTRLENVLTSVIAKLDRTSANVDALFDDENRAEVKKFLASASLVMATIAAATAGHHPSYCQVRRRPWTIPPRWPPISIRCLIVSARRPMPSRKWQGRPLSPARTPKKQLPKWARAYTSSPAKRCRRWSGSWPNSTSC